MVYGYTLVHAVRVFVDPDSPGVFGLIVPENRTGNLSAALVGSPPRPCSRPTTFASIGLTGSLDAKDHCLDPAHPFTPALCGRQMRQRGAGRSVRGRRRATQPLEQLAAVAHWPVSCPARASWRLG